MRVVCRQWAGPSVSACISRMVLLIVMMMTVRWVFFCLLVIVILCAIHF